MNLQSAKTKSNEWQFLRAFLTNPRGVGSVLPSGSSLARVMAAQIDPTRLGPVLELGPGTGSLTRGILERGIAPERLTLIEYDAELTKALAGRFPGVQVLNGDAFDLDKTLGDKVTQPFCAVVSGIPLLNFPADKRMALLEGTFARMAPGAPFIQFTYGLHSPISRSAHVDVSRAAVVWKNLPPSHVWIYRKR